MADKKMLTREEFEDLRIESAKSMAEDKGLQKAALDVLIRADRYRWIHQTTWLGEPVLNLPQDMFAVQEIIYKTKPRFIVEVGVAWGGAVLFYSALMEIIGGEKIIGIDTYIPEDLKERLLSHGRLSDRLTLINGSSLAEEIFAQVKEIVGDSREVMVLLDSYHTHEHVLQELRRYSPLVGKGHYIICGDTVVEHIPVQKHRQRPWGPGNNPKTALNEFLEENDRFEIDNVIDNKLLFSCHPGGYLICTKDPK